VFSSKSFYFTGKSFTTLVYTNGPGVIAVERANLSNSDVEAVDYIQQAAIARKSETRSGEDVVIYACRPKACLFNQTVEKNYNSQGINKTASLVLRAKGM